MLDLRQLRVLATVAEHGSMTRAAAELSYTASAVSQQIAMLERRIGTPLLVRHARGVRLTQAGRLLVERAGQIDDQLLRLESELDDLVQLRGGRVRIGAFASAASRLIPDAIARFRDQHPDVLLSLDILDPGAAVQAVTSGAVDLAVIFDYPGGPEVDSGSLQRHPLADDELFMAVPADHRLAGRRSASIAEYADDPWIRDCGPDPMCRDLVDRLCARAGYTPRVSFEGDNYLTIGRLVAAGVGVAQVPGLAVEHLPDEVAVLALDPAVPRRISALSADGAGPAATEMIKVLSEAAVDAVQLTAGRATPTVLRSA